MKTTANPDRTVAALALAAALLLAAPLGAQQRMTLAEATAEALAKSDVLRAEEARLAAAAGGVEAARGNLRPTIALEERFTRTDNPAYDFSLKINQGNFTTADLMGAPDTFNDPEPISDFQTSLTITQPLWSRRASLGVEIARAEEGAVGHERERRREEVAHRVLQAWLGRKAAEAYLETALRAEEDAAEHLRLAGVAEAAGTGLASDRLRAEVALAEARRMRLAVENDLEIARRGLGLAIGREEAVAPAPERQAPRGAGPRGAAGRGGDAARSAGGCGQGRGGAAVRGRGPRRPAARDRPDRGAPGERPRPTRSARRGRATWSASA